jgi:hypothetical protein
VPRPVAEFKAIAFLQRPGRPIRSEMGVNFISLFYNLQLAKFTFNHELIPLFAPLPVRLLF